MTMKIKKLFSGIFTSGAQTLTEGSIPLLLTRFAIPYMAANLLQALYGAADMIIVGQFTDAAGLSAVSIGSQFIFMINSIVIGLSMGGTIMIGRFFGAGEEHEIEDTIGTMLSLFVVLSVVITALLLALTDPIVDLLGTPAEAVEQTRGYIFINAAGIATMFAYNALAAIAAEKSGILKPGCRAVLYGQSREVGEIVARACVEKNIPLTVTDDSQLTLLSSGLDGQRFTYRGSAPLLLPLLGDYQLRNAMTVLDTVDALRAQGWNISADAVAHGLAAARWPGRLELVHRRPDLIIDGGHNPQCAQALAASLRGLYGGKKLIFLIGVLADKDWQSMVGEVLPLAKAIVTVRPESDRAKDENELAAWVRAQGVPAEAHASIGEALDAVLALAGPEDAVCAWGSLYSVGELRHCLGLC